MKGFDDHLDNYGDPDPGDDSLYPECEHTPPCTGDREDAPCFNDDEPTVIVEGREYTPLASGHVICPECGAVRSAGRIADHMASEHSGDDDYDDDEELGDPRPPGNLPYYPDSHDVLIREGEEDDGITTDDFDHWPNGREFPS